MNEAPDRETPSAGPSASEEERALAIRTLDFNLWYGTFQALFDVSLDIQGGRITSLIGPSGCGKTTLLRSVNRIVERLGYVRTTGRIEVMGHDITSDDVELVQVRKQIGMVFQRPNPLPLSIRDNVLFGARIHRPEKLSRSEENELVADALHKVLLWDAVKDRLDGPALSLSLEEQQKLCIARLLPVKPQGPADGRALLGARSRRHRGGRRTDLGAPRRVLDPDRHPQHGAGAARE